MEIGGIYGGFYKFTVWLTRFSAVNLIWFLFTFPFFFFIYNLLLADTVQELFVSGIVVLILAPIVFFPATTALFSVIRKWVLKEEIQMVPSFWKFYKEEYKMSMLGGIWISFISFLLAIDFYFYIHTSQSEIFQAFLIIGTFLLSIMMLHFFSIVAHAKTKVFSALKNAMFITIVNPFLSLKLGLVSGLIIYFSFFVSAFLIPFFMGAWIAFISFRSFYRFYSKVGISS